jgi:hypothetical protein
MVREGAVPDIRSFAKMNESAEIFDKHTVSLTWSLDPAKTRSQWIALSGARARPSGL